jgi:hypothetical protein
MANADQMSMSAEFAHAPNEPKGVIFFKMDRIARLRWKFGKEKKDYIHMHAYVKHKLKMTMYVYTYLTRHNLHISLSSNFPAWYLEQFLLLRTRFFRC